MQVQKYLYPFQTERYERTAQRKLPCRAEDEISYRIVDNGTIIPVRKIYAENLFGSGGVLDEEGRYVLESAIASKGHIIDLDNAIAPEYYVGGKGLALPEISEKRDETVVYLGYLYNHWGHFLVDFSNRLWFAQKNINKHYHYVFVVNENQKFEPIQPIKDFFSYLGIDDIEYISKPTFFKRIIVPEPSYITNMYFSQLHLRLFDYIAQRAMEGCQESSYPEKVYFTRKSYKKAEQTEVGEETICQLLKNNGFSIVSPEKCTLCEQIRLIRNAKIVSGIAGTIPHNMLFAKEKQQVWIFNKTYIINTMQMDINYMRQLFITYIDCYSCCEARPLGGGPFLITPTAQLCDFCKDNGIIFQYGETLERKNVRAYLNLISISEPYLPSVTQQWNSVHYFDPHLAQSFFSRFRRYIYKPDFYFRFKSNMWRALKRIKHRLGLK